MRLLEYLDMRITEIITERRQAMLQWFRQILPNYPDYVIRDLIYNFGRGRWPKKYSTLNRNEVIRGLQLHLGIDDKTEWRLEQLPFTLDMFVPRVQKQLEKDIAEQTSRLKFQNVLKTAQGVAENELDPRDDDERMQIQRRLAQQQGGVRQEPVILIKHPQGYILIEGWHRTIQHFVAHPEGYRGPAWVAYPK